jgi:hypothetical protein
LEVDDLALRLLNLEMKMAVLNILWLCPFQAVNPKVKFSYIKCALDFSGKKANLHLAVLNIFGGCTMLDCTKTSVAT